VPVIAGPRLEKTRDFARLLQDRDALFVVKNANEMALELKRLLSDDNLRQEIGIRGNQLLLDSQGAVKKGLVILEETLSLQNGQVQKSENSSESERGVTA
jgi:3-deoxy-D-manno-octulosonic-acid transferase